MNHNVPHLLQSNFPEGLTYGSNGVPISSHEVNELPQHPPRIERSLGHAGVYDVTEPIPVVGAGESRNPPRIARIHERRPSPEEERQRYLKEIFAFPDPGAKDKYGNTYAKRTEVNPESEEDAIYALRMSDQDIKGLIDSFLGEGRLHEKDKPAFIRGNNELRVALGIHFLDKFKKVFTLPERVRDNLPSNMKSPNYPGYPDKMLSRDYAAVLALSMIDGTFKERPSSGDTSQHRDAAEMVLGNHEQMKYCRWFYKTHGVKMSKK